MSLPKFLHAKTAIKSPIYIAIIEAAEERLERFGSFTKEEALDATAFASVIPVENVRWDIIQRLLEERNATELMPMHKLFFDRHDRAEELVNPAKYMALGHGKRTFGYANVCPENGHIVKRQLKRKVAHAVGAIGSANETLRVAQAAIPDFSGKALPVPEPEPV